MKARAIRCVLAAALLVACGGEPRDARAPGESTASAPAPPASSEPAAGDEPVAAPETSDRGDRVVAQALTVVARIRGLQPKHPVKGEVIGREAMIERIRAHVRREVPAYAVRAQGEVLVALSLVPTDFDYEKSILELMTAELAGYYEPANETMYIADDLPEQERKATLSHELVHALQDQHYDLEGRLKFAEDRGDAQTAVHALAEGDATSAMMDDMLLVRGATALDVPDNVLELQIRGSVAMSPGSAAVPDILKRSIAAPYIDGTLLVHALRRRGGWPEVDRVWRNPPTTTEQLLHVDKLDKREPALEVPIPPPPPGGNWKRLFKDVYGEQSVRLVLEEWLPRRTAVAAGAGWGGDRIAVWERGDELAVVWHIRYDDEPAAERARSAFARAAYRAAGNANGPPKGTKGVACAERSDRGPFAVAGRGRSVAIALGPYRRAGGRTRSTGTCKTSGAWATAVAK